MRWCFWLSIPFLLAIVCVTVEPGVVASLALYFRQAGTSLLYERELQIEGNALLSRADIERELPMERSNAWWRAHLSEVPAKLLQSPLVASAQVVPCSSVSIECFSVKLAERQPAFIAVMPDERRSWLIGADGGFMAPLTFDQFQKGMLNLLGEKARRLVVVRGLWGEAPSADEVQRRLVRMTEALHALHEGCGFSTREVQVKNSSEMSVRFEELAFPVLFEFSPQALSQLAEKGKQLRRLLVELKQERRTVKEVDLTPARMGVVRYVQ